MRALRLAAVLLATGALLVPAVPASAEGAERTGWWNRLSGGGVSLPAPTTAEGDLRVVSGGDAPSAYAAVLLRAAGEASDASLDLQVREGSAVGTPEVVACPTETEQWPEGPNQPYDAAPAYDCARGSAFGSLSADGTTLSFALDSTTATAPGVWSLALVPLAEAGSAFAVDLLPPGPDAFQPSGDGGAEEPPVDPAPPADGGGTAPPPLLSGGLDAPVAPGGTAVPPLLAGGADAPLPAPAGPAPAVADGSAPLATGVPTAPFTPALAAQDAGSLSRLLALLVLAGGCAAVGYAAGQTRPGPQLLGGRARAAVPVPAVVAETGRGPQDRPRGIGRFARERDSAPRRLR